MPLTNRILPGGAVSVTPVEDNFNDLDTMLSSVQDYQIKDGSVDTRHLATPMVLAYMEGPTGPAAIPAVATTILPAAPTNYACVVGQPVLIIGTTNLDATVALGDGQIEIWIDGVLVPETPRAHYLTTVNDYKELHTVWVFTATAATHAIELKAVGTNCNTVFATLQIMAIRR